MKTDRYVPVVHDIWASNSFILQILGGTQSNNQNRAAMNGASTVLYFLGLEQFLTGLLSLAQSWSDTNFSLNKVFGILVSL